MLETANGTTRIEAESVMSNFSVIGGVGSASAFPVLQQAITRYTWDGETANGMMERSIPGDQIDRPCVTGGARVVARASTSRREGEDGDRTG